MNDYGLHNEQEYSRRILKHPTSRLPVVLVARSTDDDDFLGTVSLESNDLPHHASLTPWLANLYVVPKHRRKGIGQELVRHLHYTARDLGYKILYLWCDPSASEWYKRQGWREESTLDYYNGLSVVVLCYAI